ncbi:single-stranded DNA-binding protein [Candidatus Mycoplasma pogonae]
MNKVVLIGRLVQDPNKFLTRSNVPYVRFTVAVRRDFDTNTNTEVSDFIPIVAWRNNATFALEYLSKGSLVAIEGSISANRYQNKNGEYVNGFDVTVDRFQKLESRQIEEQRKQTKFEGSKNNQTNNQKMNFYNNSTNETTTPQSFASVSTPDFTAPKVVENSSDIDIDEENWSIDDLI